MIRLRVLTGATALALLCGCHTGWFGKPTPDCRKPQDYQHAREVAPLKVPEGMDSPNVKDALVIPTLEATPPPPGPNEPCLDEPPRYQPPPSTTRASAPPPESAPPAPPESTPPAPSPSAPPPAP